MGNVRTHERHGHKGWRAAAVAGLGLAVAAGAMVATAAPSVAAGKPKLSPTSGPVGTVIKVTGSCGDSEGGTWFKPKIGLYYADAFVAGTAGPDVFTETLGSVKASGAYSGKIKVPARAKYTAQGAGPAIPGPDVNRAVTGQIRVQVQCFNSMSAHPWTEEFSTFTVAMKLTVTAKPAISGKAKVGKKLKASKGKWSPAPTSYSYQWYRGKKAIEGKKGTKKKYKVVAADSGKKLKVTVTAKRSGYAPTPATSKKVKIKS